jgi:hypothetical protein
MTLWILWGWLAFCLALLFGGFRAGEAAQRAARAGVRPPPFWPRCALIVPVAGRSGDLEESLAALARQDYPGFEMLVALQGPEDPAAAVAARLAASQPHLRLIYGVALPGCSRKNGNLLAGVAALERGVEVLVFADAGHRAPPGWLRGMVQPLATGVSPACSGYHRIAFRRGDPLVAGAWALVVHLMGTLRGVPRLRMPWGGATAVTRALFERLAVAELWRRTVVDDVTLGARLRCAGILPALPVGAPVETLLEAPRWGDFLDWLTRQLAFLKYLHPLSWALLGLCGALFSLATAAVLLLGFWRIAALDPPLLAALTTLGAGLLFFGPPDAQGRMRCHPAAALAALGAALWCHLRSACSMEIVWAGFRYRVRFGGGVTSGGPPAERR